MMTERDARELVDLATLTRWMDAEGIESGPVTDVAVLGGGTQNVLVRFTRGGREFVFRGPPLHKRANSDATMLREAAVLAGLVDSGVPHPSLVATCDDLDVLGRCFFLMESVRGFTATSEIPEPFASDVALQRQMGLSMVDALAALGRVDPEAAGVAHLGRPDGWLGRQVGRWQSQLASYAELDGWPGPRLPGVDALAEWLAGHLPAHWEPGLIHGDFHLGNVMFSRDEARVAAVVDWELATIGDPLLDLGHLLATWPDPADPRRTPLPTPVPGLPDRRTIIERYAGGSTRDLGAIDWYQALACYRLAVILEGSYARACAGKAPMDVGRRLHAVAESLIEQGLAVAAALQVSQ
jgi:aminoglycoside phosphotransferase (APT) family kinase protein